MLTALAVFSTPSCFLWLCLTGTAARLCAGAAAVPVLGPGGAVPLPPAHPDVPLRAVRRDGRNQQRLFTNRAVNRHYVPEALMLGLTVAGVLALK